MTDFWWGISAAVGGLVGLWLAWLLLKVIIKKVAEVAAGKLGQAYDELAGGLRAETQAGEQRLAERTDEVLKLVRDSTDEKLCEFADRVTGVREGIEKLGSRCVTEMKDAMKEALDGRP